MRPVPPAWAPDPRRPVPQPVVIESAPAPVVVIHNDTPHHHRKKDYRKPAKPARPGTVTRPNAGTKPARPGAVTRPNAGTKPARP